MKKTAKIVSSVVVLLLVIAALLWLLLFSPTGNNILKPVIEKKLDTKISNLKLTEFILSPTYLKIAVDIEKNLSLKFEGRISILSRSINGRYTLDIKDMSTLSMLAPYKLKGGFATKGRISGNAKTTFIKGSSKSLGGSTDYKATISHLNNLKKLVIKIKAGKLQKVLAIKSIPPYLDGLIDLDALLNMNGKRIGGLISYKIYNARFNHKIINRHQKLQIDRDYRFSLYGKTIIRNSIASTKLAFKSKLVSFSSKNLRADLENKTAKGNYLIKIPDLQKLEFITGRKIRGSATVSGLLKGSSISGKIWMPAGVIDYRLKSGIFTASSNRISSLKLLYMLFYPQVFSSVGKLKISFDTKTRKGVFSGNFKNGRIRRGLLTDLIKNILRFDMTREIYSKAAVNGNITKNKIIGNLDMQSSATEISSNGFIINANDNSINSKLNIQIRNKRLDVFIRGKLAKPRIKIDAKGLIRSKIKSRFNKIIKNKGLKKLFDKLF